MTLQDKLAAIQWPAPYEARLHLPSLRHIAEGGHRDDQLDAALALLAVCREWIEEAHQVTCDRVTHLYDTPCDCGRDVLLAKLLEVLDRE